MPGQREINIVFHGVRQRLIYKNQNWLCVITGETGSSKSYSAIEICDQIDPDFSVDKIFFNAESFIKALNQEKLKKGDMCMLDEAGVIFGSRDAMTKVNRRLSAVLQTFRHMNIGLILTLPELSFLDSQGRKLIHILGETQFINYKTRECRLKILRLQYNVFKNKFYRKYPRIVVKGKTQVVTGINIPLPRKELYEPYEERKKKFLKRFNQEIEDELFKKGGKAVIAECNHCGYKWIYRGAGKRTKCAKCHKDVRIATAVITN